MASSEQAGAVENDAAGEIARGVLRSLLEGLQVIGADYRYLYVNDAVLRHGRATRQALLGRTMMEAYPGIERTDMFAVLRRCMEQRTPAQLENEFTFPDGTRGWFELRFEPVPQGTAILSLDITERKRAELALRRKSRALATLSACNRALVRATDEKRFVRDVCRLVVDRAAYATAHIALRRGDAIERLTSVTGDDEGEPRELEVAPAPIEALAARVLQSGETVHVRARDRSCIGFPIPAADVSIGALIIDATDEEAFDDAERELLEEVAMDVGYGVSTLRARVAQRETEAQLVAAQRLEAVGRLAGGIAHDFNNLLTAVLTFSRFAQDALAAADPIRKDLEQVDAAATRAAALTRQLLAFGRKQVLEPAVTNLNDIVVGLEPMLRRLLESDIRIEVRTTRGLDQVMADPGQLEQVVMNLAVNARDAMPRGGLLRIETENSVAPPGRSVSTQGGGWVRLSITDSGAGMSAQTLDRIFEPFFTTKESGKGTGLGLAMVYGIVKQSGGEIRVTSEPGAGARFDIYLPSLDAPASGQGRPRSPAPPARRGNETILIAEDDAAVRRAAQRILAAAGYRVLVAADGVDALAMCETHGAPIDLLLTDVVMPRMNGRELASRLRGRFPGLRVLFASGYADDRGTPHDVVDTGARFVAKPFTPAELVQRVREALDEG